MPALSAVLRSALLCLLLAGQGIAVAGHDLLGQHQEPASECAFCALQGAGEDAGPGASPASTSFSSEPSPPFAGNTDRAGTRHTGPAPRAPPV